PQFAASCTGGSFLGFPTWYKYLPGAIDSVNHACTPKIAAVNDVWLIVAAIIEILLRIAGIAAVVYLMYGGFTYITSQGEPDKTNKAKMTIINALGGLLIAVMATFLVAFIARSIT
ncbi:MAG: hypothetical protein ABIV43_03410, partial [Candidatus Saccharimonadales bacterium]